MSSMSAKCPIDRAWRGRLVDRVHHSRVAGSLGTPKSDVASPATPKDAASLIIVKTRGSQHSILMGRRASTSRFMPDTYVFPGGTLASADRGINLHGSFSTHVVDSMRVGGSSRKATALAVTAIRETWEETGLRVVRSGPSSKDKASHPVFPGFKTDELPSLHQLVYVGRAITPPANSIRFHARFFLVDRKMVDGRLRGNGELADLRWIALSEMDQYPMPNVTRFMFSRAIAIQKGEIDKEKAPLFSWRHRRPWIRYR